MPHGIINLSYLRKGRMMEETRRDPKGRKLRSGETYDSKTWHCRYQYEDAAGRRRSVYSYTLTKNDPVPQGRKQKKGESLREREHAVQDEVISGLDSAGSIRPSTRIWRPVIPRWSSCGLLGTTRSTLCPASPQSRPRTRTMARSRTTRKGFRLELRGSSIAQFIAQKIGRKNAS